jgi:uncharacterized membrane protein
MLTSLTLAIEVIEEYCSRHKGESLRRHHPIYLWQYFWLSFFFVLCPVFLYKKIEIFSVMFLPFEVVLSERSS